MEAKGPELVAHTLDRYLSLPDDYLQALVAAFRTGVSDVPIPHELLGGLLAPLELVGATIDDALQVVLRNDLAIPASLPVALLMNFAATQVRPTAVAGPIPSSPFANLRWPEKGQAFERIEQADPGLVALIDAHAPQPLQDGALPRRHAAGAGAVRAVLGVRRLRPRHAARHPAPGRLGPQPLHARAHDARRRLGRAHRLPPGPPRGAHRARVRRVRTAHARS